MSREYRGTGRRLQEWRVNGATHYPPQSKSKHPKTRSLAKNPNGENPKIRIMSNGRNVQARLGLSHQRKRDEAPRAVARPLVLTENVSFTYRKRTKLLLFTHRLAEADRRRRLSGSWQTLRFSVDGPTHLAGRDRGVVELAQGVRRHACYDDLGDEGGGSGA